MAYDVELFDRVREYIAAVPDLADADRAAIIDGVIDELADRADHFLAKRPLGPESLHSRYDYFHLTTQTLFNFDFIVDASHRAVGVVRVVYVECSTEPAA